MVPIPFPISFLITKPLTLTQKCTILVGQARRPSNAYSRLRRLPLLHNMDPPHGQFSDFVHFLLSIIFVFALKSGSRTKIICLEITALC